MTSLLVLGHQASGAALIVLPHAQPVHPLNNGTATLNQHALELQVIGASLLVQVQYLLAHRIVVMLIILTAVHLHVQVVHQPSFGIVTQKQNVKGRVQTGAKSTQVHIVHPHLVQPVPQPNLGTVMTKPVVQQQQAAIGANILIIIHYLMQQLVHLRQWLR